MEILKLLCVFLLSHTVNLLFHVLVCHFGRKLRFAHMCVRGRSSGSDVSFTHIKVLYELHTCPSTRSSISSLAVLHEKKPDRFGNGAGHTAGPTHLVPSLPLGKVF